MNIRKKLINDPVFILALGVVASFIANYVYDRTRNKLIPPTTKLAGYDWVPPR